MKKYKILFVFLMLTCILYAQNTFDVVMDMHRVLDDGMWVPQHYVDVLESKNRDTMTIFEPTWYENPDLSYERIDRFIEDIALMDYVVEDDYGLPHYYMLIGRRGIMISDATHAGDMVKFTARLDSHHSGRYDRLDWTKLTKHEDYFYFFFVFDGDYLHTYVDEVLPENLFYTFVRMDDATVNEFKSLMLSNTCDLSNVTWPVYADGTSDSGKKTILYHKVNNIYSTTDNLRVRGEQGLKGTSLFVLPKNTHIKVVSRGLITNIDGITANWLQVEIAEDSTDMEGNAVAKGTTGWLFGGYVSTTSEGVVEEVDEAVKDEPKIIPEQIEGGSETIAEEKKEFVLSAEFVRYFMDISLLLLLAIGLIGGCLKWRYILILVGTVLVAGLHILILILAKDFFVFTFLSYYSVAIGFVCILYALGRLVRKIIVLVKIKKNSTT